MTGYHKDALPGGYQLAEYTIETVLGHGGFGVTYVAKDVQLGTRVAVKEYLPQDLALRKGDTDIIPNDEGETVATYKCGLQEFLREGQALARFKHPNIVRVLRFIEANGTAYMVMEYEKGESLAQYLKRDGPRLDQSALLRIFLPILNGLNAVHEADLLHLDIKPENIYLREDGSPMLIDFGSARQALIGPGQSQVVALTPGYAPVEQYPDNGKQGPWTDVYALGASLYRCISGKRPVAAPERQQAILKYESDPLPPATEVGRHKYPAYVLECIGWAMGVHAAERPQTAREVQDALMGKGRTARRAHAPGVATYRAGKPASSISVPPRALKQARRAKASPRGRSGRRWLAAALIVAAVGVGAVFYGPTLRTQFPAVFAYWEQLNPFVSHTSAPPARRSTARDGRSTRTAKTRAAQTALTKSTPPERPSPARPQNLAGAFSRALPTALEYTLRGHKDWVHAIAFSPDGKTLASGSYDRTIRLWNVSTGALQRVLRGHGRSINSVAYSADGRWLASAADDGTVRLWDVRTGNQHGTLRGPEYAVYAVAFSPTGTKLAAGGKDRTIFVWDFTSGELIYPLDGHRGDVQAVAFSPDGELLASGGADRKIRLWDLRNGVEVDTLVGHKDVVLSLAFTPNGRWLASGGSKSVVKLWDVRRGKLLRTFPSARHAVLSLTFSPNGKWLATGGGGNVIKLWHAESASIAETLRGHQDYVHGVAFSPNGAVLASASRDRTIKIWTVR